MRISRFYIDQVLQAGEIVILSEELAHYMNNVLRLKKDAELYLFNGEGGEYRCCIKEIRKKELEILVGDFVERNVESNFYTHLAIAMSKGERFEWALQKAVELGVNEITPLETSRCEVRLNAERKAKKHTHWKKIIISACEQSGRTKIPKLNEVLSLQQVLTQCQAESKWVLHHRGSQSLTEEKAVPVSADILVGPEGGLAEEEIKQAIEQGFKPLTLGQRVMRTETAPIAALSVLQYQWGDL